MKLNERSIPPLFVQVSSDGRNLVSENKCAQTCEAVTHRIKMPQKLCLGRPLHLRRDFLLP